MTATATVSTSKDRVDKQNDYDDIDDYSNVFGDYRVAEHGFVVRPFGNPPSCLEASFAVRVVRHFRDPVAHMETCFGNVAGHEFVVRHFLSPPLYLESFFVVRPEEVEETRNRLYSSEDVKGEEGNSFNIVYDLLVALYAGLPRAERGIPLALVLEGCRREGLLPSCIAETIDDWVALGVMRLGDDALSFAVMTKATPGFCRGFSLFGARGPGMSVRSSFFGPALPAVCWGLAEASAS